MNILVLNCGSSSVKYQLIDMEKHFCLAKGVVSRIGMTGAMVSHKPFDRKEVTVSAEILDHIMAIEYVLSLLLSPNHGVIKEKNEIAGVGHRFVHGGEKFTESIIVDQEIKEELRKLIELAPLHNPHNLRGINAAVANLPGVPNVVVFDTALHHQMPDYAFMYPLPYVLYTKYKIRRYGFHGMSHHYVVNELAKAMNKPLTELKVVSCHLGNGASVAAIKNGISVDTSMGFTPLEGLMMGSRSGDIDPAVILHIMGREELSLHEASTMLNKHSGMVGISGVSADMREIIIEAESGSKRAKLAFDMYCYRVKKYIGAYAAAMSGLDAVVFTGGIGENAFLVRENVLKGLDFLGIILDIEQNKVKHDEAFEISGSNSAVKVMVIPTNEELVIAKDTYKLIASENKN